MPRGTRLSSPTAAAHPMVPPRAPLPGWAMLLQEDLQGAQSCECLGMTRTSPGDPKAPSTLIIVLPSQLPQHGGAGG